MIARLANPRRHPAAFQHLTGLTVAAFDALVADVAPAVEVARLAALDRPGRLRAVGGGDTPDLGTADQLLLTVVWLRQYPANEALGFLFGVSDSTASRARSRCLPHLERAGRDTMRMPDLGAPRRRRLPAVLAGTPGLAVLVDTFEQRTHRPKRRQRAHYSGKKKAHAIKAQVAVDEASGRAVHVPRSAPGPTADLTLLRRSGLVGRLPKGSGSWATRHTPGRGARPRGGSLGARTGRRRAAGATGRRRGGGWGSNIRSGGCGCSSRSPR